MGDFYFFAVFFTAILGFIVSGILVFVNKTDTFTSRLLAAFLFSFSFFAMYYALQTTNFFLHVPHLWKAFVWVSFVYMPISYLYVRSVLRQSFRFERWDFLFFLPGLVYLASFIPFFLKPSAAKLVHIEMLKKNPQLLTMETESLFPNGTGYLLRILLGVGCVVAQGIELSRWRKRTMGNIGETTQNREMFSWLYRFTAVEALFYFLVTLQFVLRIPIGREANVLLISTIIGTIFFVCIYLLVKPSILYGIRGWVNSGTVQTAVPAVEVISSLAEKKKSYLTPEQGAAIKAALEAHFEKNSPFLRPGYSIAQLSQELDIPSYQLSGFINQEYAKNFNELINEYRVNHLIHRLRGDQNMSQFTLEAIGREVGFNSRAAFIAAVRKVTGKTPSEVLGRRIRETSGEARG